MRFFGKKPEKFQSQKIRKYDEKGVFFFSKKKRFYLFNCFVYKNGQAENMPRVAGRRVIISS